MAVVVGRFRAQSFKNLSSASCIDTAGPSCDPPRHCYQLNRRVRVAGNDGMMPQSRIAVKLGNRRCGRRAALRAVQGLKYL